jgi:hypothetical protein
MSNVFDFGEPRAVESVRITGVELNGVPIGTFDDDGVLRGTFRFTPERGAEATLRLLGSLLSARSRRHAARMGIDIARARAKHRRHVEWEAFALRAGVTP